MKHFFLGVTTNCDLLSTDDSRHSNCRACSLDRCQHGFYEFILFSVAVLDSPLSQVCFFFLFLLLLNTTMIMRQCREWIRLSDGLDLNEQEEQKACWILPQFIGKILNKMDKCEELSLILIRMELIGIIR